LEQKCSFKNGIFQHFYHPTAALYANERMTRIFNVFATFFQKLHTFLSSLHKKTKKFLKSVNICLIRKIRVLFFIPLNAYYLNTKTTKKARRKNPFCFFLENLREAHS